MKIHRLMLIVVLATGISISLKAQTTYEEFTDSIYEPPGSEAEVTGEAKNGWFLPTSGMLRVLVVYVELDYDLNPSNDPFPNGGSDWSKGQLPNYKDDLFDAEWPTGALQGSVTRYFAKASFDNLKILGDYVDNLIVVKESDLSFVSKTQVITEAITQINQQGVLSTNANMTIADFDNWQDNNIAGSPKIAGSDTPNSYDQVFFILQNVHVQPNSGSTTPGALYLPLLGYGADTWSEANQIKNPTKVIIHELGHLLYGGNNFHNGGAHIGGSTGKTFIPQQGGWSLIGGSQTSINTFNAWDRDRMEWKNPSKNYLNSALDENLNEIETALDATNSNHAGIYILRDFVTTGDVVRIKLPFIPTNEYQQYLWVENHQTAQNNGFEFDKFLYQDNTCMDEMQPGLYMYMQAGKNIKTGTQIYSQSGHYTRPIPANGMYDLQFESTTYPVTCVAYGSVEPYEKLPQFANPLTGNQEQEFHAADINTNNVIGNEVKLTWLERVSGIVNPNLTNNGTVNHVFTKNGVAKLGVGTNPSANSMITLSNNNGLTHNNGLPPDNRKVILNGISIEILDELQDGSIKVEVKFDDTNIANDVRWCGDIELPAISGANGYSLNLTQGNSMLLDQGFTATKINTPMSIGGTNYFVDPTVLSLESGSYFHLEQNATVNVKNNSTLRLKSGSKMELESGAKLHIFEDSDLIIEDGAELILKPGAILIIDEDATVYYNNNQSGKGLLVGATSISGTAARVEVKGDMVFDANAVWTHNRDGYYYFFPNHQLTMPNTVEMNFTGKGNNHLFIALVENTNLVLEGITATLNTGMVYYNNNSSIQLNQTDFTSVASTYNPANNFLFTGIGLNITNPTDVFINGCDFNYLATGIKIEQATTPLTVQATNMTNMVDYNYYIDDVEEISITGGVLDGGVYSIVADYGIVAINTEILEVTNTEIKNMQISGVNLDEVAGAYFSNTKIHTNTNGIYSDNSLVFLRNGAKVYDNQDYGIDMYGVYNTQTRSFTSMLTIGDEGCGSVFDNTTTGIKTKNTLLNIDAVQHTIDRQDNDTIPNQFYGNGHMFDVCYSYLVRSPGQINAKGNYWGTNPPIQSSEYTLTGNYCPGDASTPQSISLDSDDYSTCYSSTTCMDCSAGTSSMMMSGGASTVESVIQESFTEANQPFIEQDNATTRNAFLDLSSIDLIKDTVNDTWMGVSVNNQSFALTNKSVHHIQVAKAIKAKATNSNMRVNSVPKDIFAGLTENANELANIQVYPNPVNNELTISIEDVNGIYMLNMYQISGKLIIEEKLNTSISNIDVSSLENGIYFYEIISENGEKLTGKVSVVR
jgi:type IX secretion system substrate protein